MSTLHGTYNRIEKTSEEIQRNIQNMQSSGTQRLELRTTGVEQGWPMSVLVIPQSPQPFYIRAFRTLFFINMVGTVIVSASNVCSSASGYTTCGEAKSSLWYLTTVAVKRWTIWAPLSLPRLVDAGRNYFTKTFLNYCTELLDITSSYHQQSLILAEVIFTHRKCIPGVVQKTCVTYTVSTLDATIGNQLNFSTSVCHKQNDSLVSEICHFVLCHIQCRQHGHVSIRTAPWSIGRRLPGLKNHLYLLDQVDG